MSPSIPGLSRAPLVSEEHPMTPRNDKGAPAVPADDAYSSSRPTSSSSKPRRSSTLDSETELGYRGTSPVKDLPAPKQSPPRPDARRADTAPDTFGRTRQGTMDNVAADARLRMLQRSETAPINPRRHVDDPERPFERALLRSPSGERPHPPASIAGLVPPNSVNFPSGSKTTNRISTASSSSSYTSPSLPDDENNRLSTLTTSTTRLSLASSSALSTLNPRTSSRRMSKSAGSRPKGLKSSMETVQEEGPGTPTVDKQFGDDLSTSGSANLTIPVSRQRTKSGPSAVLNPQPSSRSSRKRSVKTCIKCGKKIDDGRWIPVDATAHAQSQQHLTIKSNSSSLSSSSSVGDVLCENDWKEMYLPKCRRCGLTIESQAVSSADGQLKGKYHRACFNCSTCHVSFCFPHDPIC